MVIAMKSLFGLILLGAVCGSPSAAEVKITPGEGKVAVEIDGKPFTDFYISGPEVTKPYLHPLRAASGTYVTRMWPMQNVGNEPTDHKHQRGLWFAHANVNDLDFWNNEASYTTPKRGKITLEKLGAVKSGDAQGSIEARFDWTDLKGNKLLTEFRTMVFYSDPKVRTIDFDFILTAVTKVTFHDEKDGVFGLRIRPDLQEQKHSGKIVNAEGLETEKQVWGKPSNWVDYFGDVNGEKLGIAIFDNPQNPRHPERWHARGYGLFAVNPFGLAVFTGDKSQDGSMTMEPGQFVRFRYRLVIHPGDPKSAGIAGLWEKYAK
jgi:methane monooxygenase PmoA-like